MLMGENFSRTPKVSKIFYQHGGSSTRQLPRAERFLMHHTNIKSYNINRVMHHEATRGQIMSTVNSINTHFVHWPFCRCRDFYIIVSWLIGNMILFDVFLCYGQKRFSHINSLRFTDAIWRHRCFSAEPLFTKRTDVLPQDLVKSRSREIGV